MWGAYGLHYMRKVWQDAHKRFYMPCREEDIPRRQGAKAKVNLEMDREKQRNKRQSSLLV